MAHPQYQPIDVALSLAWYSHSFSAEEIAEEICKQFDDDPACIARLIDEAGSSVVTALPPEAGRLYVELAMQKYGADAISRNTVNGVRQELRLRGLFEDLLNRDHEENA